MDVDFGAAGSSQLAGQAKMVYVAVGDNDSLKVLITITVRLERFPDGMPGGARPRAGVQQGQRFFREEIKIHAPDQKGNREGNGNGSRSFTHSYSTT